jgi:hypothetical protein
MIPGFTLCPNNLRQVAMISECEGSYIIEPMRFLYPSEAKREAKPIPNRDQLPWCPEDLKPLYRSLRKKGLRATEARPFVEGIIHRRSLSVPDILRGESGVNNSR